jgi:axial budding pattern protein 2
MSWQNTKASFMSDDGNLGNLAPLFPRPPPAAAGARYSIAESIPENTKRVTLRAVEPDESTISEADSLEAFVHSRAKHRNSSNPLFSAQISRRTSSGLRALERARSLRSRADTVSVSTFSDEFRQSIQGRPYSMSEYGDENRISQYQPLQPPPGLFPLAEGGGNSQSQLSLAHDYRGVISPLPRFWSENSLSSARRLESGSHPKPPQQLRADTDSGIPQSSSIASDLEEHLSRKASPQKAAAARENQAWNMGLEPPPLIKSASSRGLPVASSGELAFV